MSEKISLKAAERKVFRSTFEDGLWDVFIGCFMLMLAIAPLLSTTLGDFWSSAVFLPFWGLVYLIIWLVRKHVVAPRKGKVIFGTARQGKLRKFSLVMLVVNILAFILGALVAFNLVKIPGQALGSLLGLELLVGFSLAALVLDYRRLFLYGLMLFVAAPLGEWLWSDFGVSHHGYPIVFGTSSAIIILTGLVTFVQFIRNNPVLQLSAQGVSDDQASA